MPDRPWTARIHGCARPAQERLKAGQGTQMADTFQIVLRIKRLDVDAFRCVPDEAVGRPLQFFFSQRFPISAGFLRHWLISIP